MSIANTEQAEHWNTGPGVAHWVANQARYHRMHAPFTTLILDAAALRSGGNVLDVGCGSGGTTLAAARRVAPGLGQHRAGQVQAERPARRDEPGGGQRGAAAAQPTSSTFPPGLRAAASRIRAVNGACIRS